MKKHGARPPKRKITNAKKCRFAGKAALQEVGARDAGQFPFHWSGREAPQGGHLGRAIEMVGACRHRNVHIVQLAEVLI